MLDGDTETVQKKERYLAQRHRRLAVTKAARAARVNRAQIYRWRAADPAFAEADDLKREEALDELEDSLYQRGKKGDTTAAIFLLKSQRRATYGDVSRHEISGAVAAAVTVQHDFDFGAYERLFGEVTSAPGGGAPVAPADGAPESLDSAHADAAAGVLPDGSPS